MMKAINRGPPNSLLTSRTGQPSQAVDHTRFSGNATVATAYPRPPHDRVKSTTNAPEPASPFRSGGRLGGPEMRHHALAEQPGRAQCRIERHHVEIDLERGDLERPDHPGEVGDLVADRLGRADPGGVLGDLALERLGFEPGDHLVV